MLAAMTLYDCTMASNQNSLSSFVVRSDQRKRISKPETPSNTRTQINYVVRLLATYNGREHVYFLLEAALGGELFTTYERLKLYGSEVHARFYVACVTEALAHLHEKNVIYRDLKPENLLLDVKGFCKVTDMGLAKITTSPTFTMVGTPDYMAPEVIDQTGHTKSVDWWTLGVLLFELLAGHAPFESKTGNAQETYGLVKRGIETVHFPSSVKLQAAALVRNLCHRSPEVRLRTPMLREHQFFKSFDWPGLQQLRMTPPLVPQVHNQNLRIFKVQHPDAPQQVQEASRIFALLELSNGSVSFLQLTLQATHLLLNVFVVLQRGNDELGHFIHQVGLVCICQVVATIGTSLDCLRFSGAIQVYAFGPNMFQHRLNKNGFTDVAGKNSCEPPLAQVS
ncbi:unnamed protein product [Cladocopium goreaui]|uniref:cGMP-dependent protein kinase 1 (CGK 1) (CGK1) (cGMP-dependent protein kinase I) (cGKI) n=1 Tax=Cladocopium goreaui TaxID=2562237 RepID=A0A9P1GNJ6_9DINO|nr:unnamed protein product [Cladocopium goreaui]